MRVVAADVEADALDATVAELGGDDVLGVPTDVTSRDAVEQLATRAYDTFGAVDVLCNNAGVFQGGLLWECTDADFEWTLGVNLWGILHGIRAFVPRMLAAGTPGHVVNTISMAGLATTPFSGPYNVSKFAAMAATECLAHDLATVGAPIKVSAVCPGLVDTEIARSRRNRPSAVGHRAARGWGVRRAGAGRRHRREHVARRRRRAGGGGRPGGDVPRADPAQLRAAAHRPVRGPGRPPSAPEPDVRLTTNGSRSTRATSHEIESAELEAEERLVHDVFLVGPERGQALERGGPTTSSSSSEIPDAV